MSTRPVLCLRHVATPIRRAAASSSLSSSAAKTTSATNPPPQSYKSLPRTPPPPPSSQQSKTQEHQHRNPSPRKVNSARALPWVFSGLFAAGIAFYGVNLIIAARRPCANPGIALLENQPDVAARYDDTADSFDSEVGLSELLMGINRRRKELARKCTGHVLEVSCGTGRNLGYYDITRQGSVESLTFVDLSSAMIEVCKKKWSTLMAGKSLETVRPGLVVRFLTASALDLMPSAPSSTTTTAVTPTTESPQFSKYDTIIQTMGLCSTSAPVELLTNLAAHLNTSSPDSRILLLEHGRSYMPWLNRILDGAAEKHAALHGCWFNREIGDLVSAAARKAGLEVVRERRYHFGTTWVFELAPGEKLREKTAAADIVPPPPPPQSSASAVPRSDSPWWNFLGWK